MAQLQSHRHLLFHMVSVAAKMVVAQGLLMPTARGWEADQGHRYPALVRERMKTVWSILHVRSKLSWRGEGPRFNEPHVDVSLCSFPMNSA